MADVTILGTRPFAQPLATALHRVGLYPTRHGVGNATRRLGSLLGCRLIVFGWPPGFRPELEADAYASRTPALHAWWTTEAAAVGPLVIKGMGPCPRCLGARATQFRPAGPGMLGEWVLATTTLEAHAAIRHGVTDLAGTSLTWSSDSPGLGVTPWTRRVECTEIECSEPSPLMVADDA